MRSLFILTLVMSLLFAQALLARPAPKDTLLQPQNGSTPWVRFPPAPNKAAVDTFLILGGPGSWDGSFDTPEGQPSWHGWTHIDQTADQGNHWHVSTYWAENIADHGIGNHAMYCGDENLPACSESDTVGGYGDNYFDDLKWSQAVSDTSQPVTVKLTGSMTYDLRDAGWDFLELYIMRGSIFDMLDSWTGPENTTIALDYTTILNPGEFSGPDNNEVQLMWRVWSDGGWSDEDCQTPSHGACQIDNLSVFLDGSLITYDDFEPGSTINWTPVIFTGVGDFTNLRNDLGDADLCRTNTTYQVNFVDDGMVIPELPGTPCIQHCYDPGGWIVNNTGGLLSGDENREWFLDNKIISPPLAWIAGTDGAELSFDVYVDETLQDNSAGMFYQWHVRSTASDNPADLEYALWESDRFAHFGLPEYRRHEESIGDLLVPDRKWVQISIGVTELGWLWGFNGPNGNPAPYFDNIALRTWAPAGPEISILSHHLYSDNFPSSGVLDPTNLAANSCRLDPPFVNSTLAPIIADTMVVTVTPMRLEATIIQPPNLHWVMQCNPVFDSVRASSPDAQGILRGMAVSTPTTDQYGNLYADRWTFDLPDEGWFYPGDVLHYYITATSDLNGDIRTSVMPPDTTGILDFSTESTLAEEVIVRALPSLSQPIAGQFVQPSILFVANSTDSELTTTWIEAMQETGLVAGIDFDVINLVPRYIGLDALASLEIIEGYQTIIYSSGEESFSTLNEVTSYYNEATFYSEWLNTGNKRALFTGNNFWSYTPFIDDGYTLANLFGVNVIDKDIAEQNGGQLNLQVNPLASSGVLPPSLQWQVEGGCPDIQTFDIIEASAGALQAASFDAAGSMGSSFAATVAAIDLAPGSRTIALPFDIQHINGNTARSEFLGYLLAWLESATSAATDTPATTKLTVSAHPNPFNPSTAIDFKLPAAVNVSLNIFDIHGRLVRTLIDERLYAPGEYSQAWDGRDTRGKSTASGVYFYTLQAGDQTRGGKLTLLK